MDRQFLNGAGDNPSQASDSATIRLGLLIWLRLNKNDLASRLRWAYMPYNRFVMQVGYGPKAHAQLVTTLHQLQTSYESKGGNAWTLQAAILASKGNVSPVVQLSQPNQVVQAQRLKQDADWNALNQRLSPKGTLGATAPASAPESSVMAIIKLALPLINAILGKIFKVKINDPDDPVPVDEESEESDENGNANESTNDDESGGTAGLNGVYGQLRKKMIRSIRPIPRFRR